MERALPNWWRAKFVAESAAPFPTIIGGSRFPGLCVTQSDGSVVRNSPQGRHKALRHTLVAGESGSECDVAQAERQAFGTEEPLQVGRRGDRRQVLGREAFGLTHLRVSPPGSLHGHVEQLPGTQQSCLDLTQ